MLCGIHHKNVVWHSSEECCVAFTIRMLCGIHHKNVVWHSPEECCVAFTIRMLCGIHHKNVVWHSPQDCSLALCIVCFVLTLFVVHVIFLELRMPFRNEIFLCYHIGAEVIFCRL